MMGFDFGNPQEVVYSTLGDYHIALIEKAFDTRPQNMELIAPVVDGTDFIISNKERDLIINGLKRR